MATFGARVLAFGVDLLLWWMVAMGIFLLWDKLLYGDPRDAPLVFLGVAFVYWTIPTWLWGGTLGKLMLNLEVVREDGRPLSFLQSGGRFFAAILSALLGGLGFWVAWFSPECRTLHDQLVKTCVRWRTIPTEG